MSRWRTRCCATLGAVAATAALSSCGGGQRQDANEPSGSFEVTVPVATFPAVQRLAQRTHLVITIRNSGPQTIPNIAVTILNPGTGTAAQAFGDLLADTTQGLASRSRPVWIIDRAPGPCGYSCQSGGPGAAVTAYSNTWAMGPLQPGKTARFDWALTAIKAGTHVVEYRVAAGLNGKAKAVLAGGGIPTGKFKVRVTNVPQKSYVNNKGQIVTTQ